MAAEAEGAEIMSCLWMVEPIVVAPGVLDVDHGHVL